MTAYEEELERLADRLLERASGATDSADAFSSPELQAAAEVFGLSAAKRGETTIGARIGGYELVGELGQGGMGTVFLAEQASLQRRVALKVLRPELVLSPHARERFRREALAVAKLRHPNIVTVFDTGEERGTTYLVMEYVPGRGLDDLLREAGTDESLPVERVLAYSRDIARALACAHASGILHRDVKPSNVRIGDDGRAMLLDFGLARVLDMDGLSTQASFHGTLHYASPEQVSAERGPLDARTDVYSLGVLLYECLAGRRPFLGETTQQVLHMILSEEPEPIRRFNRNVTRELEAVVAKAMSKDARQRHASAGDLAEDLEALLAGATARATRGGRARAAMKLAAVSGSAVLVLWMFASRSSRNASSNAALEEPLVLRLFGDESHPIGQRLAGWSATAGGGTFGDDPDALEPAVIGDCRDGLAEKRYDVGRGPLRSSGAVQALAVFGPGGTDVPTRSAGARFEWHDGHALTIMLASDDVGYEPRLVLRDPREGEVSLGPASASAIGEEQSLHFVLQCATDGTRLGYATADGALTWIDVPLAPDARERNPGPSALVLFVDRGTARFVDFRLERRP
jgi:tRNA A-37 threonylcarbamoyl transferase component Bud32